MKYIVAIIQPDKLDDVMSKLEEKEIHLVTVSTVMGRGRQKGMSEVYRSHKESGSLLKKVKLEIGVNDDYLKTALDTIVSTAKSGKVGDGKIFVFDMSSCVRIRTGEEGSDAIG
jgi:nitrogen regulatory protein P-II 1